MSAITALNNMMSKPYFDICVIDAVAKLFGGHPLDEAYAILRPLHCVDWNKMPAELVAAIPGLIQECLGVAPTYVFKSMQPEVIDVTPPRGVLRFLGLRA